MDNPKRVTKTFRVKGWVGNLDWPIKLTQQTIDIFNIRDKKHYASTKLFCIRGNYYIVNLSANWPLWCFFGKNFKRGESCNGKFMFLMLEC